MCANVFFISSESPHDPSDVSCDLLEGIWPLDWKPLYKADSTQSYSSIK